MEKLSTKNVHQLLATALLNRCDRLALVDVSTFECHFLKHPDDTQEHQWMATATDIVSYIKRILNWGFVHPEDQVECRQRLSLFINDDKHRSAFEDHKFRFRYRFGDSYEWAELNILTLSEDEPNMRLFFLQKVKETRTREAVQCVLDKYYKILHINLDDGSFELVKLTGEEVREQEKLPPSIFAWWTLFADEGNVHPEDVQHYLQFVEDMRQGRTEMDASRSCKLVYRRRQGQTWRWVLMELIPDADFSPNHKEFMLYIQDVHDFLADLGPARGVKAHQKAATAGKKAPVATSPVVSENPGLGELMELFEKPSAGIPVEYNDLVWSDSYRIGVQSLDDAHREFFAIIQRLLHLVTKTDKDQWACKQGIKFLKQFTLQHFADEEAYMKSIKYAETGIHMEEHAKMRDIIIPRMEKELHEEHYSQDAALRFIKVCFVWLRNHVLHADMKLQTVRLRAA